MKAEHINPFISGIMSIFKEVTDIPLAMKGTALKQTSEASGNVVIMLGVTGQLKGTVAINLREESATKIVSNMMIGYTVERLDDMAISAISELGNMIMGKVSTTFANNGILIDITPPTVLTGENIQISFAKLPIISVGFEHEDIKLNFDISIE